MRLPSCARSCAAHPVRAAGVVLAASFAQLLAVALGAPLRAQPTRDVRLPTAGDPLAGFDAYAERARRDWAVPGMAVAVVRGDSVVLLRGYGVRTLGTGDSVGVHTRFANGSTTKAFTTMVAAMLVDGGRLAWDDRVADRVGGFALADAGATRELTLRDLLTHRVGFPDPEELWYMRPGDSLPQILPRLRLVSARWPVRSRFAYNNVGYALAGSVEAAVGGAPWDALVRRRILDPLGMGETTTRGPAPDAPDVATAHALVRDTLRPLPDWTRRLVDPIPPAGSMYSSAADMARWLRFLLAGGRTPDGRRLVSDSAFAELFTPQALVPPDQFYPTARLTRPAFTAYGLAWFMQDYRGEKVAYHTGSIDGMVAIVGLLPARRFGVAVFANRDHAELRHALMLRAFDAMIDGGSPNASPNGPPHVAAAARDWSAELRALYAAAAAGQADARRADSARVVDPPPDAAGRALRR